MISGGLLVICGLAVALAAGMYVPLSWSVAVSAASFATYPHGIAD
jgi:hypothetical protein